VGYYSFKNELKIGVGWSYRLTSVKLACTTGLFPISLNTCVTMSCIFYLSLPVLTFTFWRGIFSGVKISHNIIGLSCAKLMRLSLASSLKKE
jgi:hypothetical protein